MKNQFPKIVPMVTEVTSGIKVSVETFFQPSQSRPLHSHYVFAYRITIFNASEHVVQLKKRHWYIIDSNGIRREVQGEGVIGEQPILNPGESYQYVSGCNLHTEIGKMFGSYIFERQLDDANFYVRIPEFMMVAPYKMN